MLKQQESFINYSLQMDDLRWQLIQLKERIDDKQIPNEELVEMIRRLSNVSINLISCFQKMGDYKESSWKDRTPISLSMELVELHLKEVTNKLDN